MKGRLRRNRSARIWQFGVKPGLEPMNRWLSSTTGPKATAPTDGRWQGRRVRCADRGCVPQRSAQRTLQASARTDGRWQGRVRRLYKLGRTVTNGTSREELTTTADRDGLAGVPRKRGWRTKSPCTVR